LACDFCLDCDIGLKHESILAQNAYEHGLTMLIGMRLRLRPESILAQNAYEHGLTKQKSTHSVRENSGTIAL